MALSGAEKRLCLKAYGALQIAELLDIRSRGISEN